MDWSPDGKYLAIVLTNADYRLAVWDIHGKNYILQANPSGAQTSASRGNHVSDVAWSPDGQSLAAGVGGTITLGVAKSFDSAMFIYAAPDFTKTTRLESQYELGPVSWAPDSKRVVFASTPGDTEDTRLVIWNIVTNEQTTTDIVHRGHFSNSVKWSPDGKWIASGSDDSTAVIVDAATRQISRTLHDGSGVTSVSWSPDSNRLATSDDTGWVKIWDISNGTAISSTHITTWVTDVAWSPDGKYLAATSANDYLWVWEAK